MNRKISATITTYLTSLRYCNDIKYKNPNSRGLKFIQSFEAKTYIPRTLLEGIFASMIGRACARMTLFLRALLSEFASLSVC